MAFCCDVGEKSTSRQIFPYFAELFATYQHPLWINFAAENKKPITS
jgi:hypothetical protein